MSNVSSIAYLFPGQGSQSIGMLADLAESFESIGNTFERASSVLGFDLWNLIQKGEASELDLTQNAQPALLSSSFALWQVCQELGKVRPSIMAGHSLGEWSALVCAGVIEFETAVELVHLRGKYMQEALPAGEGSMAAIIGLEDALVEECCEAARNEGWVEAANFNSPGQVVIAGHMTALAKACELAKERGAKMAKVLSVSAPFHTKLMRPAADKLAPHIQNAKFKMPEIPVVHNVGNVIEGDVENIKKLLIEQIYSPVRWVGCLEVISDKGCETLIECGPGKVLSGLAKRINRSLKALPSDSPVNIDALPAAVEQAV